MDVLAPDLLWIDGRCYRVPVLDCAYSGTTSANLRDCDLEDETEMYKCEEKEDEGGDCERFEIQVLPNGKHSMVMSVARSFFPFIIGSKGATIKRISKDTSCLIKTSNASDDQNIKITGPSRNQVILAWKSISFIINSSRKKLGVTHFVSIPLIGDEIRENFAKFREDVLFSCRDRGVCEEIFQNPNKLHLTITVLVLTDDRERKLAQEKLMEVGDEIVRPMLDAIKPCYLEVSGVDCMNDDTSEVRVLYANAKIKDHDGLLQDLCDRVHRAFQVLGFSKEDRAEVKLHVTVMNTSFLQEEIEDSTNDSNRWKSKRTIETFNASNILRKFKDFNFGKQELTSVHLSTRSTEDENGYYKHSAIINL